MSQKDNAKEEASNEVNKESSIQIMTGFFDSMNVGRDSNRSIIE
jgi:hypothetical protein